MGTRDGRAGPDGFGRHDRSSQIWCGELDAKRRNGRARRAGYCVIDRPGAAVAVVAAVVVGAGGGGARRGGGGAEGRPHGAGGALFVFVKTGGTYSPRVVRVGVSDFDYTEILSGVQQGEQVALLGPAVLQAQRDQLQARVRAGTGGGLQQPTTPAAGGAAAGGGGAGGARGGGGGGRPPGK